MMLGTRLALKTVALAVGLLAIGCALALAEPARSPRSGRVYSAQLPGRGDNEALLGIAVAADGTVYVAERGALARVTAAGVRRYRIAAGRYASPAAFAGGPDGELWFTEVNRPYIGRFDPATATITQFRDGSGVPAGGIAGGPDGRLWYTLPSYLGPGRGALGAITVDGRVSVYRPAAAGLLQAASGIVADRGSLWVLGSRSTAAPRGQPQSGLLRVTLGPHEPRVRRVGSGLGDASGALALALGGRPYAVGGALGASAAIVAVSEHGAAVRYGHVNGQVSLFGAGANPALLAAGADASVWLGADGGVLEHLLPDAAAPCVVPRVVGYRSAPALARLRRDHCLAALSAVRGPRDTPAIVVRQRQRADAVLNPLSRVRLTLRRGVPYSCDPGYSSDPSLTVLRIGCAAALRLYRLVYDQAVRHGTASAAGFHCRYLKHTAIRGMGGGEVSCRARDRRHRLRLDDMYYAPPR